MPKLVLVTIGCLLVHDGWEVQAEADGNRLTIGKDWEGLEVEDTIGIIISNWWVLKKN